MDYLRLFNFRPNCKRQNGLTYLAYCVMTCRSQALGITSFAGRISSLLAPFTSFMVRVFYFVFLIHH